MNILGPYTHYVDERSLKFDSIWVCFYHKTIHQNTDFSLSEVAAKRFFTERLQ